MKRIFLLLLACGGFVGVCTAQISFGPQLGFGWSSMTGRQTNSYMKTQAQLATTVGVGMYAQAPVHPRLSVELSALFSPINDNFLAKTFLPDNNGHYSTEQYSIVLLSRRVFYFQTPLLLHYHLGKFELGVGPQLGIMLGSMAKGSYYEPARDLKTTLYLQDLPVTSVDYGARAAVGWHFDPRFTLEAMFYKGFADIAQPYSGIESWRTAQGLLSLKWSLKALD